MSDRGWARRGGDGVGDARVELAIVGALVVALGVVAGSPGIVGGLLVAAFWYAFGVPFALAGGHAVLVAVVPGELELATLLVVEAVFVALLLSAALESDDPPQYVALTASILIGLVLVTGSVAVFGAIWLAAIVLLTAIAALGYGIHRYERALWDVKAEDERDEQATGTVTAERTAEEP